MQHNICLWTIIVLSYVTMANMNILLEIIDIRN